MRSSRLPVRSHFQTKSQPLHCAAASTIDPMSKRPREKGKALPDGKVKRPRPDEVAEATAAASSAASGLLQSLALGSPEFSAMRAGGALMVDKTGAIADLLNCNAPDTHRIFFARPRKFGKSFTLSAAAEILAAGALPPTVKPWPGFTEVDVHSVFGGTEVHSRLLKAPKELRGLLQQAHFVVKLSLGGV